MSEPAPEPVTTDVDLLVLEVERDLAPDTFADITSASYIKVVPKLLPDGVTYVGTLTLRFDAQLDVHQRERIFRRARMSKNEGVVLQRAMAALQANLADITQDETIKTNASNLEATVGTTFTTAQLSNHVRSLAQAMRILAQNDINSKRELNALIRLVTRRLEGTD